MVMGMTMLCLVLAKYICYAAAAFIAAAAAEQVRDLLLPIHAAVSK